MKNFIKNFSTFKNVTFIDISTTYIEEGVKIGNNVVIYPNNYILNGSIIEDNCIIMPFNIIDKCRIGKNVKISFSVLENSLVKDNVIIGPFSHIRPNCEIEENCKIGNFVEIKNSKLFKETKANHLAYIGDASIGSNCNIGCGSIFVNYNGKEKNKTTVGNNCFIGCNSNIIAPINIADNSYICAGTTLTINTNKYDFVIARTRETIKPNRAQKYLNKTR